MSPYIASLLGLVPKPNGNLRRIHHSLYPQNLSVNNFIPKAATNLKYTTLENIFTEIWRAGQGALIIKKDIENAFRNISVALQHQWLLGFQWKGEFYQETCFSFGPSTFSYIFNLFRKAFY